MNKDLKNILVLVVLALIWGSSFILMKKVLYASDGSVLYSPLALGSLRIVLAGLVLLPVSIKHLKTLKTRHVKAITAVGIFGNAIPAFLFAVAETVVPSGLAGVLNSLTPIFVVLLGASIFGIKVNKTVILGVLIGFLAASGLVMMQEQENFTIDKTFLFYCSLIVISTACYGFSVNTIQHNLKDLNSTVIASLALFIAAIPCSAGLLLSDFSKVITTHQEGITGFIYCLILSAVGTALALMLFNRLVQKSSGVFASMVTYLIPIVAVGWGVLDGEKFSLIQLFFGVIILAGVYIVKLGRKNSSS